MCEITIKWIFGEVKFLLYKKQYDEWCVLLLKGFEGADFSNILSTNKSKKDVSTQTKLKHTEDSLSSIWDDTICKLNLFLKNNL